MKRSNLTFLMILLVFVFTASGQTWIREYGSGLSGSISFTGDTAIVGGMSSNRFFLMGINLLNGEQLYFRQYGQDYGMIEGKIIKTSDGNFVGVGNRDVNNQARHLLLVKFNSQGETLWTRVFQWNNLTTWGWAVAELANGDLVATGEVTLTSSDDVYLVKTNSQGNLIWQKTIGNPDKNEKGLGILRINDNSLIVMGKRYWYSPSFGDDIVLWQINNIGDVIATYIYDICLGEYCLDIKLTPDNGYVLAGWGGVPGQWPDFLVVKLDSLKNLQWWRLYSLTSNDEYACAVLLVENGYWVIGTKNYPGYASSQVSIALLRLNSQGDTLFSRTHRDENNNGCFASDAVLINNGLLVCGNVYSGSIIVIRTDANGNLGFEEMENILTIQTANIKVYPNPSRGLVNFQLLNDRTSRIEIFDASGRKIKETEIQNQLKIKLPVGIYFYQLNKNQKGKIVVLGQ